MTEQERFRRVDALFRAASALPVAERERYLARQCSNESSILEQVRSLLVADERAAGVLDRPALVPAGELLAGTVDGDGELPERIGRYRVIRKLGQGGMGSVYEAEQESPRRLVAVKLLRQLAGARRRRLQLFRQEAQILGRLQHPGIAQILEAGEIDDDAERRPYFVMELVPGAPVLDYARERRLGLRQRLELFVRICDAVNFAHQRGVIHRDLKPANILVVDAADSTSLAADEGAAAQPKILDFGVARLTDGDMHAMTQHTTLGELVGTVPYMSPEQAAGDPAQLDWRSDVYSLGVILFELLTGRLPLPVRDVLVHEAVRAIREDDPTPAGSIDRVLRGDIETILSKALEKDKDRRYQSAADLAADIRRYLNEQPIAARPASALYRLGKFARRNKAIVAGTVIAFAALALGAAAAVRQAVVAERARAEEHEARRAAERQSYRACLLAASSAERRHEVAEAQRHLDSTPNALRGWEWRHLASRLDDSLVRRPAGLSCVAWAVSADGRLAAAGDSAGRIRVWNAADWSLLGERALGDSVARRRVEQLVFSASGCELRVDTRSGSLTFDAETLAPLGVEERVFWRRSPQGAVALVENRPRGGGLTVVQYPAGHELFRIATLEPRSSVTAFTGAGDLLAIGLRRDRGLVVFRCADGEVLAHRPDLRDISDLCFDHSGVRLAVAIGVEVHIIDPHTGRSLATLAGHETAAIAVGFSPRGDRVATASANGTVRIWEAESGALRTTMHGNQTSVIALNFSQDGARVVTGTKRDLSWWDAAAHADPFVLPVPQSVYGLAFAPDGSVLAAACLGGSGPLRIWDVATGQERFAGLDGYLSSLAFDRTGGRLAVGRSESGAPTSIISLDGALLASFRGHFWRTDAVGFAPDGDGVLTLGNNGRLIQYSLATGAAARRKSFPGHEDGDGCRAVFSPDGAVLAVAAQHAVQLLDSGTWDTLATLEGHTAAVYALAFSSDGRRLVSGGRDRTLRIWDVSNGTTLAALSGHTDEVFVAAFSPDGTRIVSGGRDRVIRVWDAGRFDEITQLHGHTSYVYCLTFSPDSRTLASGGGDNTVRLWETRPYRESYAAAARR
jgi:WD40 repeat protein